MLTNVTTTTTGFVLRQVRDGCQPAQQHKNAEGQATCQSGDSSDIPFCETLTSGLVVTRLIDAKEVGVSRHHPSGQRHYNVQGKSGEDHLRRLTTAVVTLGRDLRRYDFRHLSHCCLALPPIPHIPPNSLAPP